MEANHASDEGNTIIAKLVERPLDDFSFEQAGFSVSIESVFEGLDAYYGEVLNCLIPQEGVLENDY